MSHIADGLAPSRGFSFAPRSASASRWEDCPIGLLSRPYEPIMGLAPTPTLSHIRARSQLPGRHLHPCKRIRIEFLQSAVPPSAGRPSTHHSQPRHPMRCRFLPVQKKRSSDQHRQRSDLITHVCLRARRILPMDLPQRRIHRQSSEEIVWERSLCRAKARSYRQSRIVMIARPRV